MLSKMDLVEQYGELAFSLDFYLQVGSNLCGRWAVCLLPHSIECHYQRDCRWALLRS